MRRRCHQSGNSLATGRPPTAGLVDDFPQCSAVQGEHECSDGSTADGYNPRLRLCVASHCTDSHQPHTIARPRFARSTADLTPISWKLYSPSDQ